MSGIILMRTAYCPGLVTSTMATQEESQFEDAFEDAESDHQTLKMLTPNGIPPQANGHVIQGKESRKVNGDLPESDIAEADYDPEEYGANGDISNVDGEDYDDEMQDMQDQYQDEDQYNIQYQTKDAYDEDEGYHQEDVYQEDEQYEGDDDQYVMDDQYIEDSQYTKEGEHVESERYVEEEDQYYEDGHYGDDNEYVEGDQHQYNMEGQEDGEVAETNADGVENLHQEQYDEYDGTLKQVGYGGSSGEDLIDEDNVDSNEYAEDDSYNHDNYANENQDSPPEDVSESDQFIDNPDLEEFRPVLDSALYTIHAPETAGSVEEPENQHEIIAEADIPDQRETGRGGLGQVDSLLPEDDSKQFSGSLNQDVNVKLQENMSLEPSTLMGGSYVSDVSVMNSIQLESLDNEVGKHQNSDSIKTESDSTEADQQRESAHGSPSKGATTVEPVKLPAAVPSKTGSLKNEPRPSKPENTMQSKESKELESILHSNLNALIGQKAKSEEQPEPPPVVEEDQGKTRRKPNPNPEKAIHKQTQGPPKSAQLQAVSPKSKTPSVQRSSPSTKSPGGPRKQGPIRTSKGRARPQQGGSRVSPARLSEEGVPALRTVPPNRNQGGKAQNVVDSSGHKTGHISPRSSHGTGRSPEVKGPGSAKPVSALKVMVQNERQKILDLDKILASQGTDEPDKNRPVPRRTAQHKRGQPIAHRHSAEYASPSSVRQEGENNEELRYSRNNGGQDFHGSLDEPRNNSNGNHIRRPASGNRRPTTRPKSAYYPSSYSRSIEESLVSTPGEVVFDDIAECNAYLQEKEYSMEQRAKSEGDFQRRRRNSYEMANRDSSEDEDPYNSYFSSLPPSHESTIQNVIPGPRANHEVFARLEDDYGADDSGNADDHPDSTQPSLTSDVSTPSTPGSQSTGSDPKPKLPPGINPLEYDAVGLRLAGHVDDSSLSLSSMSTQPVADQFSDADEDVTTDDGPSATAPPVQQSHHQPKRVEHAAVKERKSPQSPQLDNPPAPKVDIGKAMKDLEKSISTSKSALMKAPSFYVDDTGPSPVWVLQPEVALEQEQEDKRRRLKEEIKKREIEYQRAQRLQRQELHQRSDPQCYHLQDEDETEADTDTESKKLMSDEQKPNTNFAPQQPVQKTPGTMRAPDLPPTTGRIKEGRQFTRKVLLRGFSDFVFHQATQRAQARGPHDEKALKTGIRYPAAYLGSTQLITTKQPTRKVRMQQAQEAVNRIKAPEGEEQPSKEVDLAISNERIQVLNADSQETMMDHPLKTISYIADIGNIVVIMARRRSVKTLEGVVEESGVSVDGEGKRQPRKIICHVFETEDAQLIAQTIGQAFALAYLEFLKVNGIDDAHVQEMDYHDVLNSQEIYGDDLMLFSNKECEKEALVEKERGEIMGMVIVESGWGSLVPTVVVANMSPFGAAARSGKLNIGDQIMAINGTSLVGLPIHECQNVIKSLKSQALVKFNIVSCPPVTQVLIKRPDTKYQLGFSVQNGIICSLMRGGIAERGGVRVGHRIIEINGTSVVATAHEKIVDLLSTSVGEIRMKTMPLSMYKLLTGQEQPVYI